MPPERFHSLICRSQNDLLNMKAQKKTKYPIQSNSSPEPFVMGLKTPHQTKRAGQYSFLNHFDPPLGVKGAILIIFSIPG